MGIKELDPSAALRNQRSKRTMNTANNKSWYASGPFLVVLALAACYVAVYRLAPASWSIPNMAPIGALAFFCGLAGGHPLWAIVPLSVMALTDLALYLTVGYPPYGLVYLGLVGYCRMGWLARDQGWFSRLGGVVAASVYFFLVSNFGTWYAYRLPVEEMGGLGVIQKSSALFPFELHYADSWYGLVTCYAMGLPFLGRTLLSDLVFTGIFVGLWSLLSRVQVAPSTKPYLLDAVRSQNR